MAEQHPGATTVRTPPELSSPAHAPAPGQPRQCYSAHSPTGGSALGSTGGQFPRQGTYHSAPHKTPSGVAPTPRRGNTAISGLASGLARISKEETVTCEICWCSYRPAQMVQCPGATAKCGPWCGECVAAHVQSRVKDGFVSNADLCCPGSGCKAPLLTQGQGQDAPEQQLARLLRPLGAAAAHDTVAKWARFQKLQKNDTRECPFCHDIQHGRPGVCEFGDYLPQITCLNCEKEFCFYHSNAHVGRSCADYLRDPAQRQQAQEEEELRGTQKPCPVCGRRWQKTRASCNHMTCPPPCGAHWCWICGKRINPATHYADLFGTGGSCAGRMFEGVQLTDGQDHEPAALVDPGANRQPHMCDNPCTTPPQYRWARAMSYLLFAATLPLFGLVLAIFILIPLKVINACRSDEVPAPAKLLLAPLFPVCGLLLFLAIFIVPCLWLMPLFFIGGIWGLFMFLLIALSSPFYMCCHACGRPSGDNDDAARDNAVNLFFKQHLHVLFLILHSCGLFDDEGGDVDEDVLQQIAAAEAQEEAERGQEGEGEEEEADHQPVGPQQGNEPAV
eukprot:TRINITY_DN51260_c0_g1_i1.p1 TRINITY_DN51260_c0_g1~~TRINITY_DN51260_c0_g1_i1.p1  ORF type:complete len:586 (+),score=144.00 TRINITY_DN51260_c0_g1_i1:76-1758(+)